MRLLRTLAAATLAASALAVLAGPVGAAAPSANLAKFCAAAESIGDNLDENITPGNLGDNVDELKDQFDEVADNAPKKVKRAIGRIVDYFDTVGDLSAGDLSSGDFSDAGSTVKRFTKAIATYSLYVSQHCSGSSSTS
jgi:hypothetical protein